MFCNKQVQRPVSKRYLLCPAALTIRHLKKLISSKLDVTPEYQVCLLPAVLSPAGNLSLALSLFCVYTAHFEFELDIMSQVEALVGLSISPYGSPLVTLFFAFSEHISHRRAETTAGKTFTIVYRLHCHHKCDDVSFSF